MTNRAPLLATLTGADDAADIGRMAELSARYPVEWGLLFAPVHQGSGRFASLAFVERLIAHGGLRLAAHLCGAHARAVTANGSCDDLGALLAGNVQRIQINTAERNVRNERVRRFADGIGAAAAILQTRGAFPADATVDWLFDRSGGRGALPAAWPEARAGAFCGYAGGLNADSIAAALPAIMAVVPEGQDYWIDMESGLRADDRFDLDICELVLMQVYPDL